MKINVSTKNICRTYERFLLRVTAQQVSSPVSRVPTRNFEVTLARHYRASSEVSDDRRCGSVIDRQRGSNNIKCGARIRSLEYNVTSHPRKASSRAVEPEATESSSPARSGMPLTEFERKSVFASGDSRMTTFSRKDSPR